MGLGEKGEGIKHTLKKKKKKERKKERFMDTDNSIVIARGKGLGRREKKVKGG